MRTAAAGLWLLVLLGLVACGEPVTRESLTTFGGDAVIEVHDRDRQRAKQAAAAAREELQQLQQVTHAWRPSPLTTINAAIARGDDSPAPTVILELIDHARRYVDASDGLFDPGAGGLFELWGFHTEALPITRAPPDPEAIRLWLAERPQFADIVVVEGRVGSRSRATQLDFGGIDRGYAMTRAAARMRAEGVESALLRIGADALAIGQHDGRAWPAELRDPFGGTLAGLDLDDGEALFNLGNFSRFREAPDGGRWPHVLDLRTGYPARGAALVSVLHRDPVHADAAATILFVGGPARFAELVERLQLGCALMLTEENELLLTRALRPRLRLLRTPVALGAPVDSGETCTPIP